MRPPESQQVKRGWEAHVARIRGWQARRQTDRDWIGWLPLARSWYNVTNVVSVELDCHLSCSYIPLMPAHSFFKDLKDYFRAAGEITYTNAHKPRHGEG